VRGKPKAVSTFVMLFRSVLPDDYWIGQLLKRMLAKTLSEVLR
jgi:hypothetical protein